MQKLVKSEKISSLLILLQTDCRIPLEEFQNFEGEIDVEAGDTAEVKEALKMKTQLLSFLKERQKT